MANIFIEEGTMQAIGDAIRAKTGKSEGILPSDMPTEIESISVGSGDDDSSYDEGYAAGKKDEYDNFWDYYQDNGTRTEYQYAFSYKGWRNANFKPKYPLNNMTNVTSMFNSNRMTRITYPIDLSNCTSCSYMFSQCASLGAISELTFSANITNASNMFASCKVLKSIKILGTIACDFSMAACPLDKESIEYVFAALSEDVNGKTVTFKGSAVDAAFKTPDSNTNNGRESEEWKALVATR